MADSPHSGKEAGVVNMISGKWKHREIRARVSHRVWKCSYQMTVRIQRFFCPTEAAELVKFSTQFCWAAEGGPVLSYEFRVHEIKMGSRCSSDTLLIYAATKTKPNQAPLYAVTGRTYSFLSNALTDPKSVFHFWWLIGVEHRNRTARKGKGPFFTCEIGIKEQSEASCAHGFPFKENCLWPFLVFYLNNNGL